MPFQGLLHDAALDSSPAAMDEPHLTQAGSVSLVDVLFDDGRDVAGCEGVEVEVSFVERLRGMVAFESVEKLVAQMDDDVRRAREILAA